MSTTIMEEPTPDKKHKRSKSEHKKKRSREDQETTIAEETPRKSKKSKSQDPEEQVEASEKKKKKQKHRDEEQNGDEAEPPAATEASESKASRKRSSKRERKEVEETEEAAPDDRMDVDEPEAAAAESPKKRKEKKSKKEHKKKSEEDAEPAHDSQSAEAAATEFPSDPEFPFFTQTISLYVPFFPVGFDKPLTSVAAQHLEPLLNHYSPLLRGVLLSYSNLNLSDRPVKASAVNPPTDETPARLHSVDEYAVGFGWLTFDAHLFVPSRGKWMEGVVQLQSEGHIGVVCWNKFNASIEAKRLPGGWQWVDIAKSGKHASPLSEDQEEDREQQVEDSDALDGEELQVVEQMHTTGYWVNENGRKVGGKLRFRIKNFDVGQAGDYGYLSLEGTCLGDEEERTLAAEEREAERRRRSKQNPGGLLKPMSRRVPEFSMTKFGKDDEEEDDGKRAVLYKASRPGTPDD